jgi:hypothetical protein
MVGIQNYSHPEMTSNQKQKNQGKGKKHEWLLIPYYLVKAANKKEKRNATPNNYDFLAQTKSLGGIGRCGSTSLVHEIAQKIGKKLCSYRVAN